MASLDFAKYTSSALIGLSVHFDQDKRKECTHANKHINKELTGQNYFLGATDYKEIRQKIKRRAAEVDAIIPPKRVRKDRVIFDICEIKCPKELTDAGLNDEFFDSAYGFLKDYFGYDNVVGAAVHVDEVHDYYDSRKKGVQTSLEHMHAFVLPVTQEKGLNSKAFNTKKMYSDVQKKFDEYVFNEFGIHYQNDKEVLHQSVEQLKETSEVIESKQKELSELENKIESAKIERQELTKRIDELKEEDKKATDEALAMVEDVHRLANKKETLENEVKTIESVLDEYKDASDMDLIIEIAELRKKKTILERSKRDFEDFKVKMNEYIKSVLETLKKANLAVLADKLYDEYIKTFMTPPASKTNKNKNSPVR